MLNNDEVMDLVHRMHDAGFVASFAANGVSCIFNDRAAVTQQYPVDDSAEELVAGEQTLSVSTAPRMFDGMPIDELLACNG